MVRIRLKEEETLLLVLDYLKQRKLFSSLHSLELETGVSVESYGREINFLRSYILDGQWDDVQELLKPFQVQIRLFSLYIHSDRHCSSFPFHSPTPSLN
jgi:hypothetical protein